MTSAQTLRVIPDAPLCQQTLPLDWYQPEFRPYAEEFLALKDRSPEAILRWLDAPSHRHDLPRTCSICWPAGVRRTSTGSSRAIPSTRPPCDATA